METKNIILKLRTGRGMSQDELADKVMVTRQAVSRWENGDTVPNTDTLKLLSKEFDVSINTLLGEPRKLICQCCGMPIDDDSILGRDKDGTLNAVSYTHLPAFAVSGIRERVTAPSGRRVRYN